MSKHSKSPANLKPATKGGTQKKKTEQPKPEQPKQNEKKAMKYSVLDVLATELTGAKSPLLIYGENAEGFMVCDDQYVALSLSFPESELTRLGYEVVGQVEAAPEVKPAKKKIKVETTEDVSAGSGSTRIRKVCASCEDTGKDSSGNPCTLCEKGKALAQPAAPAPKASKPAKAAPAVNAWEQEDVKTVLEAFIFGIEPDDLDAIKAALSGKGIDPATVSARIDALVADLLEELNKPAQEPEPEPAPAPKKAGAGGRKAAAPAQEPEPAQEPAQEPQPAPAPKKGVVPFGTGKMKPDAKYEAPTMPPAAPAPAAKPAAKMGGFSSLLGKPKVPVA